MQEVKNDDKRKYEKLRNEIRLMENDKASIRCCDLTKYGKELEKALGSEEITQEQYDRLYNRFWKL